MKPSAPDNTVTGREGRAIQIGIRSPLIFRRQSCKVNRLLAARAHEEDGEEDGEEEEEEEGRDESYHRDYK